MNEPEVGSSCLEVPDTRHAAVDMDAFELFRKLGAGAKFDLKRFGQDASRFKVRTSLGRKGLVVTTTRASVNNIVATSM